MFAFKKVCVRLFGLCENARLRSKKRLATEKVREIKFLFGVAWALKGLCILGFQRNFKKTISTWFATKHGSEGGGATNSGQEVRQRVQWDWFYHFFWKRRGHHTPRLFWGVQARGWPAERTRLAFLVSLWRRAGNTLRQRGWPADRKSLAFWLWLRYFAGVQAAHFGPRWLAPNSTMLPNMQIERASHLRWPSTRCSTLCLWGWTQAVE